MSQDLSLCVFRIETRGNNYRNGEKDTRAYGGLKGPVVSMFQGQREIREVTIETFVPQVIKHIPVIESRKSKMEPGATCLESTGVVPKADEKASKSTVHFISGNPFVETSQGIIHLFKEDELTNIDVAALRSQTICILAVPATMTCSDLLTFIAACNEDIKHVRIIKDGSPNQYMALLTFRSPKSIMEFYKSFNGIPFTSLEPEWCCHLVFVSKIEAIGEDAGGCMAPSAHTELPICPVCLERMDESVDGILTILCNHAFHGNCLTKWGDTSCPVCRYVQTPEPNGGNRCLECSASESLWICLICGHVGCGRYLQGHAYQHYIDTHHCYSMQLGSNSVWDYVGDNFVHRILQNKADGKLVEGPNPEKPVEMKAKIDAIQLEYTYLLTTQLESQRTYYEDALKRKSAEEADWKEKAKNAEEENKKINTLFNDLTLEKASLEKKVQNLSTKLLTAQKKLNEEKDLNAALQSNQTEWKQKFASLKEEFEKFKTKKSEELDDVKEQLRDVMIFLEAEKVIGDSSSREDIQGGRIELGAPSSLTNKTRNRRHKRH